MEWLAKILNLKPQKNQGILLCSLFIACLLFSYSNPAIRKEIITSLPAEYLSIESLWMCISSVAVGMAWKGKIRNAFIKNFALFAILESSLSFLLALYLVFVQYNPWVFSIASLLYASMISLFVGKCVMAFKAKLWQDKAREDFDNTNCIVSSVTAIIGFAIATISMPRLDIAILIWGVSCIADDIGWIIVYFKVKNELIEQEAV